MDRNLVTNLGRVTEAAALASAKLLGRGDKNEADQAAVDAMRRMFDTIEIDGVVVIGEGEMDQAPMLYIGERIGKSSKEDLRVDIAVDPLDGTQAVAKGLPNAISVLAVTPRGKMLHAPDIYMKKIAAGPRAKSVIDINASIKSNIENVAKALNKDVSDVTVTMLERERHSEIIKETIETGARIKFIEDGDILAAINTCFEETDVDLLVGVGGAPEGVLAAAALKCLGGEIQGLMNPINDEQIRRCKEMGVDLDKVYKTDDLVQGDEVIFAATGVSYGELLDGVRYMDNNRAYTHSLIMRSETGTIRFMKAYHRLDKKPEYAYTK